MFWFKLVSISLMPNLVSLECSSDHQIPIKLHLTPAQSLCSHPSALHRLMLLLLLADKKHVGKAGQGQGGEDSHYDQLHLLLSTPTIRSAGYRLDRINTRYIWASSLCNSSSAYSEDPCWPVLHQLQHHRERGDGDWKRGGFQLETDCLHVSSLLNTFSHFIFLQFWDNWSYPWSFHWTSSQYFACVRSFVG